MVVRALDQMPIFSKTYANFAVGSGRAVLPETSVPAAGVAAGVDFWAGIWAGWALFQRRRVLEGQGTVGTAAHHAARASRRVT
ncbi:hypothetical protein T01_6850 [Trichinella spiralis]|uniref:Uncharacterized protein n=1 Tax=Trichinella spiralis TaxID=6334 RepID=A0A0V0ZVA4_TRISP|nr:hypothetical protein T01_6850 [Trichinella spiralis]